jgi:hypothetical protein
MSVAIVIAAAALVPTMPWGQAVSDRDLANVVSSARTTEHLAPVRLYSRPERLSTTETIDCWWAYEGAEMIARAIRPTPTVFVGFDLAAIQAGSLTVDVKIDVSASMRE